MIQIILDPNIFELSDNKQCDLKYQTTHIKYLKDIIGFIYNKETEFKNTHIIILSVLASSQMYNMKGQPWNQYNHQVNLRTQIPVIYDKFIRLLAKGKFVDLSVTQEAVPDFDYITCSRSLYRIEFLKQISYLYEIDKNLQNHIVFMGIDNYANKLPLNFNINENVFVINTLMNIKDDNVIYFSNEYRKWTLVHTEYIVPTLMSPLPNSLICDQYEKLQTKMIENGAESIETYRKVGGEVALRNHYLKKV